MLWCQLFVAWPTIYYVFIALLASQFQQVLTQILQNIHALKEETKKQEHSLRNPFSNVFLVYALL